MPTAAELLAKTSNVDKTLVIDNELRTIEIPSSVTNLGVESDDEVLRLNFRMPRYLGKTDLSTFAIRINYRNARGEGDVYSVSDMAIVGDNITFSWLVGPNATAYKGTTKFNVCLKIVDDEGYIQKEYNTTIATLPVLEGLETEEGLVELNSDLLEQWKNQLFGISGTEEAKLHQKSEEAQENIAQKGIEVLATIPEEYQSTHKMAKDAYRTRANAIAPTKQGNPVIVDDSSDDPLRSIRMFGKTSQLTTTGKNLLNLSTVYPTSSTTWRWSHEQLAVTGYLVSAPVFNLTVGATYTLSFNSTRTGSTGGGFAIEFKDSSDVKISGVYKQNEYGTVSYTFTVPEATYKTVFFFYGSSSTEGTTNASYNNTQLEVGSVVTDYESYSGGVASPSPTWPQTPVNTGLNNKIIINVYGKNLLDLPQTIEKTRTSYNYDLFTGSYGSEQPIPAAYMDKLPILKAGVEYYLSYDIPTDVSNKGIWVLKVLDDGTTSAAFVINKYAGVIKVDEDMRVTLRANSGEVLTVENIQLEVGNERTAYEPCNKQHLEVSAPSGLPGIPVSQNGNYTDANGQPWICDEIDFERGVYVQRIGTHQVTGNENWIVSRQQTAINGYTRFDGTAQQGRPPLGYDAICTHAPWTGNTNPKYGPAAWVNDPGNDSLQIRIMTEHTSVEDFVEFAASEYAAGSPISYYYPLKNPVEIELTAEEIVNFEKLHTNYFNTTIVNDSFAWMEVKYNADTKMFFETHSIASDAQVAAAVDAWLEAHFASAEGVKF